MQDRGERRRAVVGRFLPPLPDSVGLRRRNGGQRFIENRREHGIVIARDHRQRIGPVPEAAREKQPALELPVQLRNDRSVRPECGVGIAVNNRLQRVGLILKRYQLHWDGAAADGQFKTTAALDRKPLAGQLRETGEQVFLFRRNDGDCPDIVRRARDVTVSVGCHGFVLAPVGEHVHLPELQCSQRAVPARTVHIFETQPTHMGNRIEERWNHAGHLAGFDKLERTPMRIHAGAHDRMRGDPGILFGGEQRSWGRIAAAGHQAEPEA